MNLYLVRHGKTLLNLLSKNQGWIDSELTEDGKKDLLDLYKNNNLPSFDSVYCSDLGRAKETLQVVKPYLNISKNVEIHYSVNLRERFLGGFEGDSLAHNRQSLSVKEGYENFEEFLSTNSFWDFVDITKQYDPLGIAENFKDFSTRVNNIISVIQENDSNNVLIVSHANTVRYIIETLTKNELDFEITNGKIIKLTSSDDKWSMI